MSSASQSITSKSASSRTEHLATEVKPSVALPSLCCVIHDVLDGGYQPGSWREDGDDMDQSPWLTCDGHVTQ